MKDEKGFINYLKRFIRNRDMSLEEASELKMCKIIGEMSFELSEEEMKEAVENELKGVL